MADITKEPKLSKDSIGILLPDAAEKKDVPELEPPVAVPTSAPQWVQELLANQKILMQTNSDLQVEVAKLKKDNEMFRDIEGNNKIKSWEESKRDFTLKFAHLKVWNGKTIVGWKKLDLSKRNPLAKDAVSENVFIPVIFKDETEELINYSDFTNIKQLVQVKLLSEVRSGEDYVQCQFEDETVMTIQAKYLNA